MKAKENIKAGSLVYIKEDGGVMNAIRCKKCNKPIDFLFGFKICLNCEYVDNLYHFNNPKTND